MFRGFQFISGDLCFVDAEKPRVLSCPTNVTLFTSKNPVRVMWTTPTFKDNFDPFPSIQSSLNPGSMLHWGIYKNVYTATDKAGNKAFCKFEIEIGRKCTIYYRGRGSESMQSSFGGLHAKRKGV